ncbi:MAG: DUF6992 family protein [Saprospiraceae bacterium]|jgi:hypothetical protein
MAIDVKKHLFMLLLLALSTALFAQQADLIDFQTHSLQTRRGAMMVLGSWAAGNILLGASLMPSKTGTDRAFHQMNIMWNAVNLGIATIGYLQASKSIPTNISLYDVTKDHFSMQKILLLNAGLDVGYMLGGLYLTERARRGGKHEDRMRGWGRSIILQGGFLFAFDVVTAIVLSGQNTDLQQLMGSIRFDGRQIGLSLQF